MMGWLRTWWRPVLLGLMTAGIVVNFALLLPLINRFAMESAKGKDARDRQQAVYPVSVKLYEDAERRRVITVRELACFKDSSKCPPAARKNP